MTENTPTAEKIPVLIVAGFLGAGKTTFIRDLIPRLMPGPRAPYVILNDFLNAAIDAHSLRGLGAEIKGLPAGCVCCDDSGSLINALVRVPQSIRPLIIIEANGTTDPYRLIEILTLTPQLREIIGTVTQLTVINESRWGKRWLPGDKYTERAQARTASAIFTNRSDKTSDKQKQRLTNDLLELNPKASRIDIETFAELLNREVIATLPSPDTSEPMEHIHLHASVRFTPPLMSEERLRQWLLSLPQDVLRIKGLAYISETEMAYFNRTDDPLEAPRIIRTTPQEGMEPAVVFIGPKLDEKALQASFTAAPSPPPAFKIF
jgi:G3E family GTPase